MEAPCNRTSLSAGIIVKDLLAGNARLSGRAKAIMAANSITEVPLPFVRYWFEGAAATPDRSGGYDTLLLKTACYAATLEESVILAELVRESLEMKRARWEDGEGSCITMLGCSLAGFEQYLDGKAFAAEVHYHMKASFTRIQ